jgi:hypothetical protein
VINGAVPVFTSSAARADLALIHQRFGRHIAKVAAERRLPAAWVYGFIFAEASRRDWDRSCSPCDDNCSIAGCQNHPICPTTGAPACAYGLMQTIPATAKAAGIANAADLVGNPELGIRAGTHLIAALFVQNGYNLPGIAAWYLGGGPRCRGSGVFGFGSREGGDKFGRDDYAYRVTLAANTAHKLGYDQAVAPPPSSLLPALAAGALAGAAAALVVRRIWVR